MLSITRGSIGDVDEAGFRWLVREREHLFVERKQDRPGAGFGPTVASFANMLGGWLLIGVLDRPAAGQDPICGWSPKRGEPQQLLTQELREQVDPLPLFAVVELTIDGKIVWAVRVFPGDLTPYIVLETGSVYVRTTDGKQPIRDAATLLQLADRGRSAERQARVRIEQPDWMPLLSQVLTDIAHPARPRQPVWPHAFAVRAVPVSLDPGFADRVLSQSGYEQSDRHSHDLQRPFETPHLPTSRDRIPRRRGYVFEASAWAPSGLRQFRWVTDAGGGIGVRIQAWSSQQSGTFVVSGIRDDYFKPILSALARDLTDKEAYGRCLLDARIDGLGRSSLHHDTLGLGRISEPQIQLGGELVIPTEEDEVDALADAWTAELARAAGHGIF